MYPLNFKEEKDGKDKEEDKEKKKKKKSKIKLDMHLEQVRLIMLMKNIGNCFQSDTVYYTCPGHFSVSSLCPLLIVTVRQGIYTFLLPPPVIGCHQWV